MKTLAKFIFALCMVVSVHSIAQNAEEANGYWQKNVVPKLMGSSYFNYKCRITSHRSFSADTIQNPEYTVHITPQGRFTYFDGYWLLKKNDSLYILDFGNKIFSFGASGPDRYGFDIAFDKENAVYSSTNVYIPFYYETQDSSVFNIDFLSAKDTVYNNKDYKVLRRAMQKWSCFDSARNLLPIFDTIDYYVNTQSFLIEKMVVYRTWDTKININCVFYNIEDCEYSDISFSESDIEGEDDNLFSINEAIKQGFSVYNFNKDMPPSFGNDFSKVDFDGRALDVPLINIDNDTTTLRNTNEWKLLYFWIYACRPCLKTYEHFSVEKEANGCRVLEKNGIRLFALYSGGQVTAKFKSYTEKYGFSDIAYSALGIANYIQIKSYPYYILLSPSNEVVYKTQSLGDYSELLKAKKEYEQKKK